MYRVWGQPSSDFKLCLRKERRLWCACVIVVSPDWFSMLIFATKSKISLVASFVLITFLNALLRESVVIFLPWLLGFTSR